MCPGSSRHYEPRTKGNQKKKCISKIEYWWSHRCLKMNFRTENSIRKHNEHPPALNSTVEHMEAKYAW